MSEPTVSVVLKRIYEVLEEESEIFEPIGDQIDNLLSRIEKLNSYLNCTDEDKLLAMTDKEKEEMPEIDKVINTIEGNCSFIRRFLVQIAHDSEDVIDNIVYSYKLAYEGRGRFSLFRMYACKSCIQIDAQCKEQIKGIIKRLDYVEPKIKEGYVKEKKKETFDAQVHERRPKDDINVVVGLEHDINSLVDKLTKKGNQVRVLYIVGKDGSGKTTLATELSNHHAIKEHFESVVWASASGKRDAKDIFLDILRARGQDEDAYKFPTTEDLMHHVSNILEKKPYLIILDDVEDPDKFNPMIPGFQQRWSQRSKIIITTEATPSHPYKHEEYDVSLDEDEDEDEDEDNEDEEEEEEEEEDEGVHVDSVAKKLTAKKTPETSIFHLLANQASALLLTSIYDDKRLKEHFYFRAWIYIKSNWDDDIILLKILIEIIRHVRQIKEIIKPSVAKLVNFLHQLDQSESGSPADILDLKPKSDSDNRGILLETLQKVLKYNINNTEERLILDTLVNTLEDFLAQNSSLIVLDQVKNPDSLVHLLHPILKNKNQKNKAIFINRKAPKKLQDSEECIEGKELLDTDSLTRRLIGEGLQPSLFFIRDLHRSGYNTKVSRKLYDHPETTKHFDQRVWIEISGEPDVEAALHQIIEKTTGKRSKESSTKDLAKTLVNTLWEKKFLLVLNNLGDSEELIFDLLAAKSSIKSPKEGEFKSKIILNVGNPRTFRYSNLKCYLYQMKPLTDNESRSLLCSTAVCQDKNNSRIEQVISQFDQEQLINIVKICKGMPMAIVALGGLLSTKDTAEEWETMITSLRDKEKRSKNAKNALEVEDILQLSYSDLPSELNLCFLYFSLFPQHSEISTGIFIRMLISEGLVSLDSTSSTKQTLESIAAQYLESLARRCIIQVVRRNHIGKLKKFRLYEKFHQLSVTRAAELGFLEQYHPDKQNTNMILLRKATIHPRKFDGYPKMSSKLRTYVQFGKHGLSMKYYDFPYEVPIQDLEPIYEHFKLLRILVICGIRHCNTLPEEVGGLVFLTYLGLRATSIQALPETIRKLQKLITLDYQGSLNHSICKPLPDVLSEMKALRHIYLPGCAIANMKKLDLTNLQHLQTLWGISGGVWLTNDLAKLSAGLVKLGIVKISSKHELEEVVKWLNKGPKRHEVLKLDWHRAEHGRLLFPENLSGFQRLHKLALIGRLEEEYNFKLLPSIVKLELFFSHFENNDPLEKLGELPKLKILLLWNSYKGTQWTCGPQMFPKLEELRISSFLNLEKWIVEKGAMQNLEKLSIFNCRKLLQLPKGISYKSLRELKILDMPRQFCTARENLDITEKIPCVKFEAC